jgi:hypothetical protein
MEKEEANLLNYCQNLLKIVKDYTHLQEWTPHVYSYVTYVEQELKKYEEKKFNKKE